MSRFLADEPLHSPGDVAVEPLAMMAVMGAIVFFDERVMAKIPNATAQPRCRWLPSAERHAANAISLESKNVHMNGFA